MLNRLRNICQNPFLVTLVAFNFLFVSCQLNESISAINSDESLFQKSHEPSGEDIVRSVFFLQENIKIDVLQTLSNKYKNLPDSIEQEYNIFVDETIYKMDSISPNFFKDLKNTVKKGTQKEIEEKLGEGALLIKTSFLLTEKYRKAYYTVNKIVSTMDLSKYNLKDVEGMNAFIKAIEGQIPADKINCGSVFVCAAAAVYVAVGLYAAVVATAAVGVGVAVVYIAAVVTEQRFWTGSGGGGGKGIDVNADQTRMLIKEETINTLMNLY